MQLITLLLSFRLVYYFMILAKKDQIKVRSLPTRVTIPEAVGKAAKMGQPLFLTPGIGGGAQ